MKNIIQNLFGNRKVVEDSWYYDYVYIERDSIFREYWENVASVKKIKILTLGNANDFNKHIANICRKNTKIYLDCDVANSKKLLGYLEKNDFLNVFLITNIADDNFFPISWLRYSSKVCPFDVDVECTDETEWFYEYVYIEDDECERDKWKKMSKINNVKILLLSNVRSFNEYSKNISKDYTKIYLDCNLGYNEMRGDDFAKILFCKGYKNLYVASNFSPSRFSHLPWLKYAGKGCPFS